MKRLTLQLLDRQDLWPASDAGYKYLGEIALVHSLSYGDSLSIILPRFSITKIHSLVDITSRITRSITSRITRSIVPVLKQSSRYDEHMLAV